jgi:Mrp family chromosome partitioning ATPase
VVVKLMPKIFGRSGVRSGGAETAEISGSLAAVRSNSTGINQQGSAFAYSHTRVLPIAEDALRESRIITGRGQDAVTVAYKVLRTQVLRRMAETGWSTLAVTSPQSGEGKTITAINLAIAIAQDSNHTVLLVDLNLRSPRVAQTFGYHPDAGIGDLLRGEASIQQLLLHPPLGRLVVLPGRDALEDASELITSSALLQLVGELKSRYPERIVVFDMPAVLEGDEVLAFAPIIDSWMLVVAEGKTATERVRETMGLLPEEKFLGVALTRARS